MNFLAPLLLTLGLAAAVPLLLHLMRRRLGTRVEFPATRYLIRAEQENSRRLRLRNLALMLLRVLLIVLIALAAARPVGRLAGTGHPATALALVLDNSLSTGVVEDGAPVLSRLTALASEVLAGASSSDRLWLVTPDGTVRGGNADELAARALSLAPAGGSGDLPLAVSRAASLVEASGLPARQVLVLTDGQSTSWARTAEPTRVAVSAFMPAGSPPPNRGVVLAEARPLRFTPRGTIVVRTEGGDSTSYAVEMDGRVVGRGVARSGEEAELRLTAPGEGWLSAVVTLPPDELRGDDSRHLALIVGPPPAVRVDATAGAFVPSALDALIQSGVVTRGDEVLVAGADAADRLPALLTAPADPVLVGAANRNLERLGVPWRYGTPRRGNVTVTGPRLDDVTASLRYPLVSVAGASSDTLATAGGAPWVVAGEGYVVVGSPLDVAATSLPLRAAFVPWLGELLAQRLSSDPVILRHAAPGGRVSLPPLVTGWVTADGTTPESVLDGAMTAPASPGVYFLLRGLTRVGAVVVNPEPEESVLQRLSPSTLRSRLGSRDAQVTTNLDAFRRSAFDPSAGRSLVTPLLALALLVLGAEGWMSRRGSGRPA